MLNFKGIKYQELTATEMPHGQVRVFLCQNTWPSRCHTAVSPPMAGARSLLSKGQAAIKTSSEQIWGQRDPVTLEIRKKSNA